MEPIYFYFRSLDSVVCYTNSAQSRHISSLINKPLKVSLMHYSSNEFPGQSIIILVFKSGFFEYCYFS